MNGRFVSILLLISISPLCRGNEHSEGEQLARIYCSACHTFTEPELLPKRSWNFLLMYMGLRMGIEDYSPIEGGTPEEIEVIKARKTLIVDEGNFPENPMVTDEQWSKIRNYFLETAPEKSLAQPPKPKTKIGLPHFVEKQHRYSYTAAVTTMLKIDETHGQILVGDSRIQKLTVLDRSLQLEAEYKTGGSLWVRSHPSEDGLHVLSIGDLTGSMVNQRRGVLFYSTRIGKNFITRGSALSNLYRPADFKFGDFDGDGVDEVVVCNFGLNTGSVDIHKAKSDKWSFESEPWVRLTNETGAVECHVADYNGDGFADVSAIFGNARENLNLFLNNGDGTFERRVIHEKYPALGYVGFRWVDFDSDGDLDVFTISGDNVDADPYNSLKPYQGIRLYLNNGDLNFEESYFYPMYGAYGLEIEDFDLDGDLDLAAISFNPDFNSDKPEGFVYLQNQGSLNFTAHTFEQRRTDRWLTMDAGDFDGDGDKDIILGGGYIGAGLSIDNKELAIKMSREGRPLLVMENQIR
ncbi:FG-GAP repeat domain-containing protein [Pelagicoccus mobilis]|uniref:VCBS repeat-containing protein n=1 Tax=Pelagicoccus mobilis TaxID=415221 RepID=A0A934RVC1_9BACT|nr:VCBS repeat-containing protein [Pelagicoccus mobilis]MBK1875819.1 VCBS repeat-containing protein [Pelagicoccus mobilis]